jgi:hypothetical protein
LKALSVRKSKLEITVTTPSFLRRCRYVPNTFAARWVRIPAARWHHQSTAPNPVFEIQKKKKRSNRNNKIQFDNGG